MFAGIGGFRSGLTRAGDFRCVGHCEIDKYANASYQAIYEPGKEERYYPDATQIDPADLPDFDLLCGVSGGVGGDLRGTVRRGACTGGVSGWNACGRGGL